MSRATWVSCSGESKGPQPRRVDALDDATCAAAEKSVARTILFNVRA